MIQHYKHTVAQRFLKYVTIDTQSNAQSNTFPSTEKQKDLSVLLAQELVNMGVSDAHTDEYGYVYATIPSNTTKTVPTICFCSHVDTTSDCSGFNVKPLLHKHYNGEDIVLPDDTAQIISPTKYPYLLQHIGHDIITASGTTLLGADDKSGVAIIMDMANYLTQNPQIIHGNIKILFTPDEEIGKGTDKLNMQKLNAQFGYTLDGDVMGSYNDQTFSANQVTLTIHGVSAHPGDAKNKMVNAIKIISEIIDALPQTELCPEHTEKLEGFIHPLRVQALAEKAIAEFLIRDFKTTQLEVYEKMLQDIAVKVLLKHPKATMTFEVVEQYSNMKDVVDEHPQIVQNLKIAYENCDLTPFSEGIRGGTDGSRLSYIGLPCPNIFTGMQNVHSKHEWIGVRDMEKSVQVLVELAQVWERNS